MRRGSVAMIFALVVALVPVTIAFGHAQPAKIVPGDGAVLTTPPATIEIEMTQDMPKEDTGASDIDVVDASGKEVTTVAGVVDNGNRRKLSVAMPTTLQPGVYTVRWKTLSADDGDPANGTFTFTYDPNGTASPGTEVVRPPILGETPTATPSGNADVPPAQINSGNGGGTSWPLVAAVAVGMFVLGGGTTFLLVQKKG